MNACKKYALREFQAAGWCDKGGKFSCETQQAICDQVLRLLDEFASEGHSGSTAPYTIELFTKLAQFKPITPLTGADEEWNEPANNKFQNKRNSAVFKEGKNGRPYYLDAWVNVWEKDHSVGWSGAILLDDDTRATRAYIKDFSQMPTITILIPSPTTHGEKDSDWDFLSIPRSNLSELEKYYDLEIQPVEEYYENILNHHR